MSEYQRCKRLNMPTDAAYEQFKARYNVRFDPPETDGMPVELRAFLTNMGGDYVQQGEGED